MKCSGVTIVYSCLLGGSLLPFAAQTGVIKSIFWMLKEALHSQRLAMILNKVLLRKGNVSEEEWERQTHKLPSALELPGDLSKDLGPGLPSKGPGHSLLR